MDSLNEVICHRGSEKSINNRAIIYSSKLIGEAYWGKQCVRVCNYPMESEGAIGCCFGPVDCGVHITAMLWSHAPIRYCHYQKNMVFSIFF